MNNTDPANERPYITEEEARTFKQLFDKLKQSYKEKDPTVTDREWLAITFRNEFPDTTEEDAKKDAEDIIHAIGTFAKNLRDVDEASQKGISKERWLAEHIERNASNAAVQSSTAQTIGVWDEHLKKANEQLADAVLRKDGQINMNPNLNGNLAEHMVARSFELNALAQNKNITVKIPKSNAPNSFDIILKHDGTSQHYQCKFCKDAKSTIQAIENGNYNNQRIVVPTEQVDEVRAHFLSKGSQKTITDHLEVDGITGSKYTKEELVSLQEAAQKDGLMPSLDYNNLSTKEIAASIGKNTGKMALLSMALTTGANLVQKLFKGEKIEADELVKDVITTGADTSVKIVTAGTLQVAVRKGILKFIPKNTSAGILANIACVAVENVKILWKIAKGELSLTQGIDRMGRTTTAMIGGFIGAAVGVGIAATIPVVGIPTAIVTGFIGGMLGYSCGEKIGDMVYSTVKKVATVAKEIVKKFITKTKEVFTSIKTGIKRKLQETY